MTRSSLAILAFALACLVVLTPSTTALVDPQLASRFVRPAHKLTLPLSKPATNSVFQVEHIDTTAADNDSGNHTFTLTQFRESTVVLSGCSNVNFGADVYINGQGPFNLVVDTGSTTLGVISDICVQRGQCAGLSPYFDTSNLTPVLADGDVGVTYADQTAWSGFGWRADVSLGNASTGGSYPVSMVFGTIDTNKGFMTNTTACGVSAQKKNWHQGIIGFAYPSIASAGTDEWFQNYVDSTGIDNEFTLQLCAYPGFWTGGNLWIGAYDLDYLDGQFTYINIVTEQHYNVYLSKISVNSQTTGNAVTVLPYDASTYGPCPYTSDKYCAIIDSGTTYLSLPDVARAALLQSIQNDANYQSYIASRWDIIGTRQCYGVGAFASRAVLNTVLPTVSFSFGADANGNNPTTIVLNAIDGYLVTSYDGNGNAYYCLGIGSTGTNAAILGYSFMTNFITRHDIANRRIGFAPARNCGKPGTILLNLRWEASPWSQCDRGCGGGHQWRHVNCTDLYGRLHNDIACFNGFAGPKPAIGQSCNVQSCPISNSTKVTSVSIISGSGLLTQGDSVTFSFQFTGAPNSVSLWLQPIDSNNRQPFYIAKNASFDASAGSGVYQWTVPATLPTGTYVLGGHTLYASYEFLDSTSNAITVSSCGSAGCGLRACGTDGAYGSATCGGHGTCDDSAGVADCDCVAGYSNTTCNVPDPAITRCSIQCLNNGYADMGSCTCVCPNNFAGVLCENRYASLTAVLAVNPTSIDALSTGDNNKLFKLGFAADVAYAAGVPVNDVSVRAIIPSGSTGTKSAVSFWLAVPTTTTDLKQYVSILQSLVIAYQSNARPSSASSLSLGLFAQYLTSITLVSYPPDDIAVDNDNTGDDLLITLQNHLTLIIGVSCGVIVGLFLFCLACICMQRRETRKTLSHSAHRRKKSVLKRELAMYGEDGMNGALARSQKDNEKRVRVVVADMDEHA